MSDLDLRAVRALLAKAAPSIVLIHKHGCSCGTRDTDPRCSLLRDTLRYPLNALPALLDRLERTEPRACVVGAVFDSAGKLLLGRRLKHDDGYGMWVLPGGGIDGRETFQEALKREIAEECGIDTMVRETLFTYRHLEGSTNNVVVVMRADYAGGKVRGGDDLDAPAFFSWTEIAALDTTPATQHFLAKIRQSIVPTPESFARSRLERMEGALRKIDEKAHSLARDLHHDAHDAFEAQSYGRGHRLHALSEEAASIHNDASAALASPEGGPTPAMTPLTLAIIDDYLASAAPEPSAATPSRLERMEGALRAANVIRSALGFMFMRMAVAASPQDAYDVAKREFEKARPALERFDAWRESAEGRAALASPEGEFNEGKP